MEIYASPKTVEKLKEVCPKFQMRDNAASSRIFGMPIYAVPTLPNKIHSGKYILPDGSVVSKNDVRIDTKYVEYGPEDTQYLLQRGVIKEHMEEVDYVQIGNAMREKFMDQMIFNLIKDFWNPAKLKFGGY